MYIYYFDSVMAICHISTTLISFRLGRVTLSSRDLPEYKTCAIIDTVEMVCGSLWPHMLG